MKRGKTKSYDVSYIMLAHQILLKDPAQQMTITALALEVGLNPTKLQEGFKDLFRQTIHQYRLDLRLNLAMELLDETDMTIAEIAYKLGFDSREGLTRCFRKKYSQPPRAWRQDHDEEGSGLQHAV
jgi:AraC-like DNA-binding protein